LRRKATALLESGNAYTIGAVGLVGDGSITGEVYQDDLTPPAQGNSKLRLVYASPDACTVDVVPAFRWSAGYSSPTPPLKSRFRRGYPSRVRKSR
jgi:hypothetical protein